MAPETLPDETLLPPDLHRPVAGARPGGAPPKPPKGIGGLLERLTGPYATSGDKAAVVAGSAVGALLGRRSVIAAHPSASAGEGLTAMAAAGSLVGGALAGASPRTREWMRPSNGAARDVNQLMAFSATHVHPMVAALFAAPGRRTRTFVNGAILYAGTLGATALVATRPVEKQQAWSWGSTAALSAASLTALRMPRGWEWLGPTYTTRLLVGHAASG